MNRYKNPQQIRKLNSIYIKKIIHHNKWDLFQGCKDGSISANQLTQHINKMENKSQSSLYIFRNSIWQNLTSVHNTLNKVGLEGKYLNTIKAVWKNSQLTSYPIMKSWKLFLTAYSHHLHSVQTRKRTKQHPSWKKMVKLSPSAGDRILYVGNSKDSNKWIQ